MAANGTIPTIDLSPLRGGSAGEKREVAKAIDAAARRHRHDDADWTIGKLGLRACSPWRH